MADKQDPKKTEKKQEKKSQEQQPKPAYKPQEQNYESLIRVAGYDLPGSRMIYPALTRIKGVSWAVSNLICKTLGLDKSKRVKEFSKDDFAKIEAFLKNPQLPEYLKNRRFDPETGTTSHLFGTDLDIARDFDIKRMKKMKSYKGIRHTAHLPVRGQRTRSHFRAKGRATGIGNRKKPAGAAAAPAKGAKGGKA